MSEQVSKKGLPPTHEKQGCRNRCLHSAKKKKRVSDVTKKNQLKIRGSKQVSGVVSEKKMVSEGCLNRCRKGV